jgi:hypothetical protein
MQQGHQVIILIMSALVASPDEQLPRPSTLILQGKGNTKDIDMSLSQR